MRASAKPDSFGPSELARLMSVSIKALRHYERRGLLRPGRTHRGWRRYTADDVERLTRVLALRQMGFGLAEIATLLDAEPGVMAAALAEQEARLIEQRGALDSALAVVRRAQRTVITRREQVGSAIAGVGGGVVYRLHRAA